MILAIDQGSTKTQALIGDEQGHIIGTGLSGGACHFLVGLEKSKEMAQAAAENAIRDAGISAAEITRVSAGMAGANWPDEFEMLTRALEAIFPSTEVKVFNDCVPALYAGSSKANSIILCAGTSFNAAVLKNRKVVWIYNNYVERRDEGGIGLSQRAMESIFHAPTMIGEVTSMTERAMEFFGYTDLLAMLLDFSRGKIQKPLKDFARIVDEEAVKGDAVALDVQYQYGLSVSRYATAALRRYDLLRSDVDVVLSGGIFKAKSPVMEDAIRTEIHRIAPLCSIVPAHDEPVVGAYQLALGMEREAQWRPILKESVEKFSLYRY